MRTDELFDTLVADLSPVSRPSFWRNVGLLVLLATAELAVYIGIGHLRPDLPTAMAEPSWWWKLSAAAVIALIATATALRSFTPARDTRRGWQGLAVTAVLVLTVGWAINGIDGVTEPFLARLDWRDGIVCLGVVLGLSILPVTALGLMMRRGAATNPDRAALAAGLAAAGWGTAVFAFHCPHDDVLYIVVWYGLAMWLVTGAARLVLPRLTRW